MSGKYIGLVIELLELICILTKSELVVLQYVCHTLVFLETLDCAYTELCEVLSDADKQNFRVVVGGDFNTVLHHGTRGEFLDQVLSQLNLKVLKDGDDFESSWTFCSN